VRQEAFAQPANVGQAFVAFARGMFERASEADGEGDRLGAGSPSVLLMSAPHPRRQRDAAPHQQRPDAFGAMKLVRADAERIDAEIVEVDGDLAGRLHRIAVEASAPLE
jgi:hypothetical protein